MSNRRKTTKPARDARGRFLESGNLKGRPEKINLIDLPIHPQIETLGFLEYVAKLSDDPKAMAFLELKPGGHDGAPSKHLTRVSLKPAAGHLPCPSFLMLLW